MQETITLNLPANIKSELDNATREEGMSFGELINEAIKQYLFLRQFRLLRERMVPQAQEQGIQTDQDVFDRVS